MQMVVEGISESKSFKQTKTHLRTVFLFGTTMAQEEFVCDG